MEGHGISSSGPSSVGELVVMFILQSLTSNLSANNDAAIEEVLLGMTGEFRV